MPNRKIAVVVGLAFLICGLWRAGGQEKATPEEIISKVREAANALAKSTGAKPGRAALEQFDQKQGPWVWKDTYVFVVDCAQVTIAAHPVNPELIGKDATSLLDTKRPSLFLASLRCTPEARRHLAAILVA